MNIWTVDVHSHSSFSDNGKTFFDLLELKKQIHLVAVIGYID